MSAAAPGPELEIGVTLDCADPVRLARFWALALGYVEPPPPAGHGSWPDWWQAQGVPEQEWGDAAYLVDPRGRGPRLSLLRVPERKTVKNRVHLDLAVSGGREVEVGVREERIRSTADTLLAAGAVLVREVGPEGALDHLVLADPEGNELCVV